MIEIGNNLKDFLIILSIIMGFIMFWKILNS